MILLFLTELFKLGLSYSALGTARAAVNCFTTLCGGPDFSDNRLLKNFMKGIFHQRPNFPKHPQVWDVKLVLEFFRTSTNDTLIFLSGKLCTLFLLLSAQRCQTLHLVQLQDVILDQNQITILTNHLLKQSRPNFHLEPITLVNYPKHKKLCIVETFKQYLDRTASLRFPNEPGLLISTQSPHKGITRATIARWVKNILTQAGIDATFTAHSTRAVATSTAKARGISLDNIAKTAGWSNVTTFRRFYDKPLPQTVQSAIQQ